jgi:hypothetical protein
MARQPGVADAPSHRNPSETSMFKFVGWTAGIIFLIGLLVVVGVFKLIF